MTKTNKTIKALRGAAVTAGVLAMLAWGGHSDYVDQRVATMKGAGVYFAMADRYPGASDGELVKIYDLMTLEGRSEPAAAAEALR